MNRELVVLIVEDHPGVRDTLERMVESWFNVELLSCSSFLSAAAWIAAAPRIDLVICDVCLPGEMTGIDVADIAVKTFADVAVVMISADPEADIAGLTTRYSFVRKPFDRDQLIMHIENTYRGFKVGLRAQAKIDASA